MMSWQWLSNQCNGSLESNWAVSPLAIYGLGNSAPLVIQQMGGLFLPVILIVIALVVLIVLAMKLRHWLLSPDEESSDDNGGMFSISDLRELCERGDISEQEFENAKRVIVAHGLSMLRHAKGESLH